MGSARGVGARWGGGGVPFYGGYMDELRVM